MAGRRVADRAEPVERQSPGRRHDGGLADRRAGQQVTGRDVVGCGHGQEELAAREPKDRLVASQQVHVGHVDHDATSPSSASDGSPTGVRWPTGVPAAGSSAAGSSYTARTSRWLR